MTFRTRDEPRKTGDRIEFIGGYCAPGDRVTLWHWGKSHTVLVETVNRGYNTGIVERGEEP